MEGCFNKTCQVSRWRVVVGWVGGNVGGGRGEEESNGETSDEETSSTVTEEYSAEETESDSDRGERGD